MRSSIFTFYRPGPVDGKSAEIGIVPIFGVSLLRRNVRILKNGKCPYFEPVDNGKFLTGRAAGLSNGVNQDDSASQGILEHPCF